MSFGKKIALLIVVVALAGALYAAGKEYSEKRASSFSARDWYAIRLNTGATYFGHLVSMHKDIITLSDAHYFEVYENARTQSATATSTSFQMENAAPQTVYKLVRQGSDPSLATDHTLFVNRNAVVFWEKLNADSDTVKNIEAAKQAASQ